MNRGGDGSGVRAGARAQGPMPVSSFRVADRRGYTQLCIVVVFKHKQEKKRKTDTFCKRSDWILKYSRSSIRTNSVKTIVSICQPSKRRLSP